MFAMKIRKEPIHPEDLHEFKIVENLNHPNIIKYEEAFLNEHNHLVLVMEYAA
jgi:hypothetical protein